MVALSLRQLRKVVVGGGEQWPFVILVPWHFFPKVGKVVPFSNCQHFSVDCKTFLIFEHPRKSKVWKGNTHPSVSENPSFVPAEDLGPWVQPRQQMGTCLGSGLPCSCCTLTLLSVIWRLNIGQSGQTLSSKEKESRQWWVASQVYERNNSSTR